MLHFEILIQRTNQESIWSLGYWKHFDKQRFWKLNCIIQYKRCALNALLSSYSPNPPLNPIQQKHALSCSQAMRIHCFILSWKPRNDKGPAHLPAPLCSCVPTWSVLSVQCPCPPHIDWLPGPEPGLANHPVSELLTWQLEPAAAGARLRPSKPRDSPAPETAASSGSVTRSASTRPSAITGAVSESKVFVK